MANQAKSAMDKKSKKQSQIEKLQREVKELEEKSQMELGKYIMKKWNINSEEDSEKVFSVIDSLKDQAINLLEQKDSSSSKDGGMGKHEDQTTPPTH